MRFSSGHQRPLRASEPDKGSSEDQCTNPLLVWPRLPDQVAEARREHQEGDVHALVEQYPRF
jgi:hypothetical protein